MGDVRKQTTMFRFFSIIQVSSISFGLLRLTPWVTITCYWKAVRDNKASIPDRETDSLVAWKSSAIQCAVLHNWKRVCYTWENFTFIRLQTYLIWDFFVTSLPYFFFTLTQKQNLRFIKDFKCIRSHHRSPWTLFTRYLRQWLHSPTVT